MRRSRFSFIAGSVAVGLLALVGFATFGDPTPSGDLVQIEAAAESIGHASGAYAGLAFAYLVIDVEFAEPAISDAERLAAELASLPVVESSTDEADVQAETSGSTTSNWLSEVEVRALVSLYFEAEDVNRAVRVAWCESRFDPTSVDLRTGAVGLFRHLPRYWAERSSNAGFQGADPTEPEASTAAAAWAVYNEGGWDVFACRD